MPGIKLATAYYELIPSMAGAQKQIVSQLTPAASKAGASAGARLGSSMGSAIGGALRGTATAAVSGVAVGLGAAITKGFGRLSAIDTAQAKLRGLGKSQSQVTSIMASALKSVKGTAFGLGDAATVAAQAVAAGIKPGRALTKTLTTVANSAAASGTDLGSMGNIFGRVAASGKAYNGELQQLSDRGIPIYQVLAKQLHKTTDGVFKLASEGKISFAQFQKAAATASGNVAQSMGKTVPGAIANMWASVGRIGANLMSGFFPLIAPTVIKITDALGGVEAKASDFGKRIASVVNPVLKKFGDFLDHGLSGLGNVTGLLAPAIAAFGALGLKGLGPLIGKIPLLTGLGPKIGALGGPLGIVVAALGGLIATSPQLQAAFGGALQQIFGALSDVFGQMSGVTSGLGPALSMLSGIIAGVLTSGLHAVVPLIVTLIGMFGDFATTVLPPVAAVAGVILNVLGTALQSVFGFLAGHQQILLAAVGAFVAWKLVMGGISFVQMVAGLVASTAAWIGHTAALIADKTETVILAGMYVGSFIKGIVMGTGAILKQTAMIIASTAAHVAHGVAIAAVAVASGVATAAQWAFNAAMNANPIMIVVLAIAALVAGLIWFFTQTKLGRRIWSAFVSFFRTVTMAVLNWFRGAWQAVSSFFVGIWSALRGAASAGIHWISSIIRAVVQAISNAWRSTWNGVKSFFTGIWNGIKHAVSGVAGFFRTAFNAARQAIVNAFHGVVAIVKAPINGIISLINGAINGINRIHVKLPGWLGGASFGVHLPTIPHLASGGIVEATPGGTAALLGEGRFDEAVLPLGGSQMREFTDAVAAAVGGAGQQPLVGSLTVQSTGDLHTDMDEVMFRLRQRRRGGR